MDVLVRWEDNSMNVVFSNELKTINSQKITVGCSVKMLYRGRWYCGKVMEIESCISEVISSSFDSDDDVPLSKLQNRQKSVSCTNKDETLVHNEENFSSDDDLPLKTYITLKNVNCSTKECDQGRFFKHNYAKNKNITIYLLLFIFFTFFYIQSCV